MELMFLGFSAKNNLDYMESKLLHNSLTNNVHFLRKLAKGKKPFVFPIIFFANVYGAYVF